MSTFGKFKNFTDLALALRVMWMEELVMESAVATLYNMTDTVNKADRTRGLGNYGLVPDYNGTLEKSENEEGPLKTFTQQAKADFIEIEEELIKFAQYNLVEQKVRGHGISYDRTATYDMSSTFNNAFSTTGRGAGAADGLALCSSAAGRNSGKADTRNKGSLALTHDAVTTTRSLMRQWTNDKGLKILAQPDTLLVPENLAESAIEITRSDQRSDNANNATNYNRGLNVIVDPLLEDDNNWFMIDSRKADMHLWWLWSERPNFAVHPASEYDMSLKVRGKMYYAYGADNHTWIYGHEVAAS